MQKAKLHDYQLESLKTLLSSTYDEIEDYVLDEYKVSCLEELNASDFEDIKSNIYDWHEEITSDLV